MRDPSYLLLITYSLHTHSLAHGTIKIICAAGKLFEVHVRAEITITELGVLSYK